MRKVERGPVFYCFVLEMKEVPTSGAAQDVFSPSLDKPQREAGRARPLVFVMPKPVILKDIRFPENTQMYSWRIREGFPTQSEALG